jgi:hypothetical protein
MLTAVTAPVESMDRHAARTPSVGDIVCAGRAAPDVGNAESARYAVVLRLTSEFCTIAPIVSQSAAWGAPDTIAVDLSECLAAP